MTTNEYTKDTERSDLQRLGFKWGPAQPDQLDLIDSNGVAILVDTGLLIDLETEGNDVKLALMVPSSAGHLRLVEPKGKFLPKWLNPIGRGQSISFVAEGLRLTAIQVQRSDRAGARASTFEIPLFPDLDARFGRVALMRFGAGARGDSNASAEAVAERAHASA